MTWYFNNADTDKKCDSNSKHSWLRRKIVNEQIGLGIFFPFTIVCKTYDQDYETFQCVSPRKVIK